MLIAVTSNVWSVHPIFLLYIFLSSIHTFDLYFILCGDFFVAIAINWGLKWAVKILKLKLKKVEKYDSVLIFSSEQSIITCFRYKFNECIYSRLVIHLSKIARWVYDQIQDETYIFVLNVT